MARLTARQVFARIGQSVSVHEIYLPCHPERSEGV